MWSGTEPHAKHVSMHPCHRQSEPQARGLPRLCLYPVPTFIPHVLHTYTARGTWGTVVNTTNGALREVEREIQSPKKHTPEYAITKDMYYDISNSHC